MSMHAMCFRCAAALDALNKAQSLSNVQASDSYLCALMAAADGTLVLPDQQQKQQQLGAAAAAAAAGKDTATPRGSQPAHSRYGIVLTVGCVCLLVHRSMQHMPACKHAHACRQDHAWCTVCE